MHFTGLLYEKWHQIYNLHCSIIFIGNLFVFIVCISEQAIN